MVIDVPVWQQLWKLQEYQQHHHSLSSFQALQSEHNNNNKITSIQYMD